MKVMYVAVFYNDGDTWISKKAYTTFESCEQEILSKGHIKCGEQYLLDTRMGRECAQIEEVQVERVMLEPTTISFEIGGRINE